MIGTIKFFIPLKGYGFIETPSEKDIFVHISAINKSELGKWLHDDAFLTGQKIEFEVAEEAGKRSAVNLRLLEVEKIEKDVTKLKLTKEKNLKELNDNNIATLYESEKDLDLLLISTRLEAVSWAFFILIATIVIGILAVAMLSYGGKDANVLGTIVMTIVRAEIKLIERLFLLRKR